MKHRWSIPVVAALWLIAQGVALTQAPGPSTQNAGAGRAQTPVTKNPLEGNRDAIRNGGAMFRTRCAGCHGPDARGDRGPDLTGLWASGASDDKIFQTVRQGIPGSEMPAADPSRVPDRDIWQVLAYVQTLAASAPPQASTGTPENGERIFQKTCRTCHMVNASGGELGPDLSRIGSGRPRAALTKKIRTPSENIRPGYEPVTLVLRDGQRIRGVKKNEDEFSIQVMDARQRIQGYVKANLTEVVAEKQSVMPAYGSTQLSDSDLDDLLSYLNTLRGPASVRR
jgi:putative heme-binding domain-containing protein